MLQLNFHSIIFCVTRYSPENPITVFSLIGHIWINFNPRCISSRISDHFPIHFLFKPKHQSERETCMFRIFNDMNYEKFKESIFSVDFSNILLTLDPNSALQNFYDHLLLTYNRCFPIKEKIGRNVNRSGWITQDLKFCIGKKCRS